jgi:DUF4097 and DUF4098 domain-containing protein YvlB
MNIHTHDGHKHAEHGEHRDETFTAQGPISLSVHLLSGDMVVRTSTSNTVEVHVTATGPKATRSLEETEIHFDPTESALVIHGPYKSGGKRTWMDVGNNADIDVELLVPEGSSVDYHSASGDAAVNGTYDAINFASASGDLIVDQAKAVNANTASGDVVAAAITETTNVKLASGDVQIARLLGDCHLECVSGDVFAQIDGPASVDVHAVSGDVTFNIREGLVISVDAKSMTGDLRSDIDLSDDQKSDGETDGRVDVKISTVSGDVRIGRAGNPSGGLHPLAQKILQKVGRVRVG